MTKGIRIGLVLLVCLLSTLLGLSYLYFKESRQAGPIAVGGRLQFSAVKVQNEDGQEIFLSSLVRPSRASFLSFWATWCEPCLKEIPAIMRAKFSSKLPTTWINLDYGSYLDRIREVRSWKKANKIDLVTAFDHKGELSESIQLQGLPVNLIAAADGKILWMKMGSLTEEDFKKIEELSESL